jgi:hypothetical protein
MGRNAATTASAWRGVVTPPNHRLAAGVIGRFCYLFGLTGVVAVLVAVDRSPSDVANQAALLMLVLGSVALGFAVPRKAWLSAITVGASLSAAHLVYQVFGSSLPYSMNPPGVAGALTLLMLLIPAFIGCYLGVAFARAVRTRN